MNPDSRRACRRGCSRHQIQCPLEKRAEYPREEPAETGVGERETRGTGHGEGQNADRLGAEGYPEAEFRVRWVTENPIAP